MTIPLSSSSHIAASQPALQTPTPADSASAANGSAAQMPQVPLHALAAPSVAEPRYETALARDELGIVSGYLQQQDQLAMRDISTYVRTAVDPTVTSLTLTGPDANALFSSSNALNDVRELRLTKCNDGDLLQLANAFEMVRASILGKLELILDLADGNVVTAAGLVALAPVSLAGISLKGMTVTAADAFALSLGGSPVSISLPNDGQAWSDLPGICRIRTLKQLHAPVHQLSAEIVGALQSHPSLMHLSVGSLSGAAVSALATSASLETLSIKKIADAEVNAFTAIAQNRVLRSFTIGQVDHAQSLAILSGNAYLTSVSLGLSTAASNSITMFANMPQLQLLSLSARQASGTLVAADVQALCARPFAALALKQWEIDAAAMALLTDANTHDLSLDNCYPLSHGAVAGLAANRSLRSLSLLGGDITPQDAITLAASATLQHFRAELSRGFAADAKQAIETAWTARNKPLANLDIRGFEQDDDDLPMEDA